MKTAQCEHCGYDLAGLLSKSEQYKCPECGRSATGSGPLHALRYLALACGPTVVLIGAVCGIERWSSSMALQNAAISGLVVSILLGPGLTGLIYTQRRLACDRNERVADWVFVVAFLVNSAMTGSAVYVLLHFT